MLVTRGLGKRKLTGVKSTLAIAGLGLFLLQPVEAPSAGRGITSIPAGVGELQPPIVANHYSYDARLNLSSNIHSETSLSTSFNHATSRISNLRIHGEAELQYVDIINRLRFAEDESILLGEELFDIDLVNKIDAPSYNKVHSVVSSSRTPLEFRSKHEYIDLVQRLRHAEDEALLLGDEFIDIDLLAKIEVPSYYNEFEHTTNVIALNSFTEVEIDGPTTWSEHLQRDDEELILGLSDG